MSLRKDPFIIHSQDWNDAIPQFNVGHSSIIQNISDFETMNPGIHISGSYLSGVSVGDCVASGKRSAFVV
jgi:oxygen-dependent protoporphyrinogen oxidase